MNLSIARRAKRFKTDKRVFYMKLDFYGRKLKVERGQRVVSADKPNRLIQEWRLSSIF